MDDLAQAHNGTATSRFDVLELSSGFLSIPTDDWASLIEFTASHGLRPKPEVGIQCVTHPTPSLFALLTASRRWGAGGDASVEELESAGTRDPKWLIDRAKTFLDAGAYVRLLALPPPRDVSHSPPALPSR